MTDRLHESVGWGGIDSVVVLGLAQHIAIKNNEIATKVSEM